MKDGGHTDDLENTNAGIPNMHEPEKKAVNVEGGDTTAIVEQLTSTMDPAPDEKRIPVSEQGAPAEQHTAESVASTNEDSEDEQPKLPMSKARCIALVLTLTGAAFLNVRARLYSRL